MTHSLRQMMKALLEPKSVAVLGASRTGDRAGNLFLRRLISYGYPGAIYPVHPIAEVIEGLQCYRSLASVPGSIDYAYIAIPASEIAQVLNEDGLKVCFAQIVSSGFGETENGLQLELELLEVARKAGVRIVGPNSLGTFSPKGRLTYMDDSSSLVGPVAVVSQSGGLSVDIVRSGTAQGIAFRCAVSIGNAIDVSVSELTAALLEDPQVRVVGLYLEGLKDGEKFIQLMRDPKRRKPVVILKGGRTEAGAAAVRSHTGSLAIDRRVWEGVARQCGLSLADSVEGFLNRLSVWQDLDPRMQPTRRVVVVGNGGGYGVLAADMLGEAGFELVPPSFEILESFNELGLPPGTSFSNPIDAPSAALSMDGGTVIGKMLNLIYDKGEYDAVIVNINLWTLVRSDRRYDTETIAQTLVEEVARVTSRQRLGDNHLHVLLILRSGGGQTLEKLRAELEKIAHLAKIPTFGALPEVVEALTTLREHEEFITFQR